MMDNDYKAYEEALEEKHGKLLGCSYSDYSSGMMMNSNSLNSYDLQIKDNDESVLTVRTKAPFGKTFISTLRIKDEDLKELSEYIEESRFWAFNKLKYHQDPNFVVYDYSLSSGFSLIFDDRAFGGSPFTFLSINAQAMNQFGFSETGTKLSTILIGLQGKGELLSAKEEGEDSNFFNTMSMNTKPEKPKQETELSEDNEVCPCCGYKPVTGKFCPECGTRVKK